MLKLQGIAVSPGVAIGEAQIIHDQGQRVTPRYLRAEAVDGELARLEQAIAAAAEIQAHREDLARELGHEYGAIFDAHLQMLRDPRLREKVETLIRHSRYAAEWAVVTVLQQYVHRLRGLESAYLRERAMDVLDIQSRLVQHLTGSALPDSVPSTPVLLLAHNLTPSQTAKLDRRFVRGFATEVGGPGSHTAIVAGALEIPAVVGVGPFLSQVAAGQTAIIDGNRGELILQPDEETLQCYRRQVEAGRELAMQLEALRDLPAVTACGQRVVLMGNIEFPDEVEHCNQRGSDGIGLYRTEFLFLGDTPDPSEETQFEAYARVVRAMQGRPVVIRTQDLGADKLAGPTPPEDLRNPNLGLRSIRLSLSNLPAFRRQLRAIVRASVLGDVRLMFPMISTLMELRQAKMVLADVMEDLEEEGGEFRRDIPVGMMVEVPSAILMIEQFVKEIDFLSIGTNDLIQYTLAVDRDNRDVAASYCAAEPAVLKLIQWTIEAAQRHSIPVNICGQMSGDVTYTMLLLGLGLRSFSVTPSTIPEIKKVCRSVTIAQCEAVAQRVMQLENARDIQSYLKEELKKFVPDLAAF